MKISCPSCSAKYSIADEKVQNRLAKIRCRKCGTSIVIDGNVSPANVYAADAEAPAQALQGQAHAPAAFSGTSYSVDLGETDQRQMSVAEIVDAYNSGAITAETFVWADGFPDWTALGQVDEIVAALHAAANQDASAALTDETSALGASTVPDENPWEASGPSIPQAPVARAVPTAPVGGGADLFGNVARAGSEYDQHASASPFGGGRPAPAAAESGARNESSVLFSLSALTSGASNSRPSMPAPASSTGRGDDSGLIDLRALTAAAETSAAMPAAPRPAMSPLGAPSPLGGPLGMSPLGMGGMGVGASLPPQAQKSNTGLFIGGGIVIAAVAVAAIITFGGNNAEQPVAPPTPAAAVAAPTPTAAAEPVPTAAPLPTADAKPPSTGTEQDDTPPAKGPAPRPRPKASGSSPGPSASPSPSPAPSAAPKKAATGKCGCKTDDLMCLMNCAQ